MVENKELHFKPYARLLTMLGEQLIKDEKTALVELIRNSYDADASRVTVDFEGFGEDWSIKNDSRIIITDDGCGMTRETIESAWMNPASPNKLKQKAIQPKTPLKKRTMVGEKGIGRFAIFKLGMCVKVTTRALDSNQESKLEMDFSSYLKEFTELQNGQESLPFLDELTATLSEGRPTLFNGSGGSAHGTRLEISHLKAKKWTQKLFDEITRDISHLQPIFSLATEHLVSDKDDFSVSFKRNGKEIGAESESEIATLRGLLEDKAVLKVEDGCYDDIDHVFTFRLSGYRQDGAEKEKTFDELRHYSRERFSNKKPYNNGDRFPECGSFRFSFYAFDPRVDHDDVETSRYYLKPEEFTIVKNHRIYLYRDNMRVFPYGDVDDDWLRVDALRGTSAASAYLSNDQVVGCIEITQKGNPKLKDKTSREGLVSEGAATLDFIEAIQIFLQYLRKEEYSKYRADVQRRKEHRAAQREKLEPAIGKLAKYASTLADKKLDAQVKAVSIAAKVQKETTARRCEILEDLAGVGLSVETAAHDMMMMASNAKKLAQVLETEASLRGASGSSDFERLHSLVESISFIEDRVRDFLPLFRSSRQKVHQVSVREILRKVLKVYGPVLRATEIPMPEVPKDDFTVSCTDAVLMQSFINLLDNSLYWLTNGNGVCSPQISISMDANAETVVFADNGPGITPENAPYIFDPFFSTKKDGRGLGLYIAKQLLGRYGYSIRLLPNGKVRGATFELSFQPLGEGANE
ncbi:MAG: ATP-binding protein [Kiritimatiellae bacterium]|nr:ATP-binding protein [Kiritimatiellia bacterium]